MTSALKAVKSEMETYEAMLWQSIANAASAPDNEAVLRWAKAFMATRQLNTWYDQAFPSGGASADHSEVEKIVEDVRAAKKSALPEQKPVIMIGCKGKTFIVNMTREQMMCFSAFVAASKATYPDFNEHIGWQHWLSVREAWNPYRIYVSGL
jgi:hypothetical protein